MLQKNVQKYIESGLSQHFGRAIGFKKFSYVGGGCINETGSIESDAGKYFVKWNKALTYPQMFTREHTALKMLRSADCIRVPEVYYQSEHNKVAFIVMEFIESGSKTKEMWRLFGEQLANLHMNSNDTFGLDHDNYIGHLPQKNQEKISWAEFFIVNRLTYQSKLAFDNGFLNTAELQQLAKLYIQLPSLLPEENPALLHGDLWSGNYMVDQSGRPVLIDPAVYYGHREVDLSMMKLFGGFDDALFEAYEDSFPLQPGFEMRIDLFNLYPLMVHINLFGASYVNSVRSILRKYA